jgi:hypothetical protein
VRATRTQTVTNDAEPTSPTARRIRTLLVVAFVLLVWVKSWHFPDASAAPILDPSFMQALGQALLRGLQFGVDIVYTYGPLGWFNASPHQPGLDWIAILGWELLLKLAVACFLGAAALRLRSPLALAGFALALVLPAMGNDAFAFLAIVAAGTWAIRRVAMAPTRRMPWAVLLAPLALLAALALVKFTYTMLVLVTVACIALMAARRAHAALILVLFAAILIAAWWAIGQSPANLPAWFATSLQLAAAYGTAQSLEPGALLLALCLFVLVSCLSAALLALQEPGGGSRPRELRLAALVWLAGLIVAYKSGFTRASGNEICFFGFAGAAVFLLPEPATSVRRRQFLFASARALACIAALVGFAAAEAAQSRSPTDLLRACGRGLVQNVRTVFSLPAHERMREVERDQLAHKYALPRTRALVGDATIDVFGAEQGFVFLNDLRWHPRPVFQSFAAMTDALSRGNARFLAGPDAPRFVLFLPTAIDKRLEGMEDARSLRTILRDYEPVLRERAMLLFQRRADAPRNEQSELVLEREIRPGETLDLSGVEGGLLILELDAHLDPSGRVRTLLLGGPPLTMEVEASDGFKETVRIVPSMLASGAIVRPWLQSPGDWVRFLVGDPVHAIARLRFVDCDSAWHAPFVVRVRRAECLVPEVGEDIRTRLRWSMFSTPPSRFESPLGPDITILRGYLDALVVQSPSALTWTLQPGAWRLHAQFGFLPSAWREGPTDGAIARVEMRGKDGARNVVFERLLDPKHRPLDGQLQSLDVEVRLEPGEEVALTTDPGPAGDTERDLIFWTDVAFTPVQ